MTAQSSATDNEAFGQNPPAQHPAGRSGTRSLAIMAGAVGVLVGVLATLVFGVAIGSALRKRIDRWRHGYR
jgi:hypothetical protein